MKLTPHEQKVLELIKQNPDIVEDHAAREKIAEQHGYTEKTLRNRIGDLKKYGVINHNDTIISEIDNDVTLYHNFRLVWQKKRLVLINTLLITVLSVIISLLLPNWYSSTAVIVTSGNSANNFLSMVSGLPIGDFGMSSLNVDISTYIAILESRSVKENIIRKFDLINRYKDKDIEYARGTLSDNTEITVSEEGTLILRVFDKDPIVARNMANQYLVLLDSINQQLGRDKGKSNRLFLGERLNQNKVDLKNAEINLKIFQQKHGVIDIPTQIMANIEEYAKIHAIKVETEIQQRINNQLLSKDDPKLIQNELFISELNNKLQKVVNSGDNYNVLLAFNDIPDLAMNYTRLIRELEIQNKILEIILPQYEQARLEENKNIPSIQIIDAPEISLNKAKPYRKIIVIMSLAMAIIMSILFIFGVEYVNKIKYYL